MIIVVLAVLLLVWLIWERLVRRSLHTAVFLDLSFSHSETTAGETIRFREVVENRSRFPVPAAEVSFRLPRGIFFENAENMTESDFNYKRDVFSLLGRERITRSYNVKCRKRGHYTISQTSIRTRALPSHNQYIRQMDVTDSLYVYPRRVNVQDILLRLEMIMGLKESTRRVYEDPFAFASIREYTIQDPMKTINWKASARTGSLMVNTYTSVTSEQLVIYLDVEDSHILKEQDLVEEGISCAATLASSLLARNLETCLVVGVRDDGAPMIFGGGRGSELRASIEQYLTKDFLPMETVSIQEMLAAEPPRSRIPVIFTKNADASTVRTISGYCGEQGALLVALTLRGEACTVKGNGKVQVLRREVTL